MKTRLGSRRGFLKSAAGAAAVAAVASVPGLAAVGTSGPVRNWETSGSKRYAAGEPLQWKPRTQELAGAVVLDPKSTRQEILGFGGAMTDATCYVLSQLKEDERAAVMHDLFSEKELGLNVCRTCIGASDYSRSVYSFDDSDTPDPELKKFSIDHDKEYILPMLRQARKTNPELFLFSSPWSPPGWMKSNGSMLGGAMRTHYFDAYAHYFRRFLEGYKAEGVEIQAVTIQNESDTEQDGRMPACLWAQEYEMGFVSGFLGPTLRKAGMPTKIWILDHNFNLWGRVVDELSDPKVYEYVDGVAWHPYVGDPSSISRVHDLFPEKNAYWTEGGPDVTAPDYATDWARWGEVFNGALNNWARSITAWNLALDEKGNPNVGPFPCGGVLTVEGGTDKGGSHKVSKSGQYWAFAHYSKHIQRGAKAFPTNGPDVAVSGGLIDNTPSTALTHSGFRNPDGSLVVVLANRGPERRVQLVHGLDALDVVMPKDSIKTLHWN